MRSLEHEVETLIADVRDVASGRLPRLVGISVLLPGALQSEDLAARLRPRLRQLAAHDVSARFLRGGDRVMLMTVEFTRTPRAR